MKVRNRATNEETTERDQQILAYLGSKDFAYIDEIAEQLDLGYQTTAMALRKLLEQEKIEVGGRDGRRIRYSAPEEDALDSLYLDGERDGSDHDGAIIELTSVPLNVVLRQIHLGRELEVTAVRPGQDPDHPILELRSNDGDIVKVSLV